MMISCTASKDQGEEGFVSLLNNTTRDWSYTSPEVWNNHDGILTGVGGQSYASTNVQYDNFILEAEFKPDDIINSGIFVRCPDKTGSANDCYEINISDDHANQDFRTGAIVTHGKPLAEINTIGKWNTYKIKADKNHIEVWLNGTKTADLIDDKVAAGHIVLQVLDKGVIRFRNIRIKEL